MRTAIAVVLDLGEREVVLFCEPDPFPWLGREVKIRVIPGTIRDPHNHGTHSPQWLNRDSALAKPQLSRMRSVKNVCFTTDRRSDRSSQEDEFVFLFP